jgi:copper resistance protein D
MYAAVKASLYFGVVLLVGAGWYRFLISPEQTPKISRYVGIGFLLIFVASISNILLTIESVLGRLELSFIWDYATNTQHGRMTFLRLGLGILLVGLTLFARRHFIVTALYSLLAIGFLCTISILSHTANMGRPAALLSDLIHICSATLWVGAILFSVLTRVWQTAHFETIVKRISNVALVSVLLLVTTGIYASFIHIQRFEGLFNTFYGRTLLVKLAFFALALTLATINRWYFMPRLLEKKNSFANVLVIEVALLVSVLAITGVLTVGPLPHD